MSRRHYMMLSFTYSFQTANDEVYCAYTVPYNYTALQAHVKSLKLLTAEESKSHNPKRIRVSNYSIRKLGPEYWWPGHPPAQDQQHELRTSKVRRQANNSRDWATASRRNPQQLRHSQPN